VSTVVDEKDPDVSSEYFVDFHDALVQEAERRAEFSTGVYLYFPRDTGFYYEVTTAGRLAQHYPHQIPRAAGETIADGSAVLTCRHPDSVVLAEPSSVAWTVPTGITNASQRISGMRAYITLSGGTDGVDYDILCRMTPTAGNIIEQTITVPVRAQ
jgi:hypothetical protein